MPGMQLNPYMVVMPPSSAAASGAMPPARQPSRNLESFSIER